MYRVGVESLVVVCLIFSLAIVYADYQVNALIAFKERISDDPGNVMQSWNPSLVSPCTWYHIKCDEDDQVISIDLGHSGISGQLAPELGLLKDLQYLELFDNNLNGSIPNQIGNLSNLIGLDLYNNSLSGLIPNTLGKLVKLKFLRIEHNELRGPIPLAMPYLKDLIYVSLGGNDGLCGPFTARCINSDDPTRCTDNYNCPCRCGPTFTTPCDYNNVPRCNTTLCCWN